MSVVVHPRVRTFKARRGRTTSAQRALLDESLGRRGLPGGPIDPADAFGRAAPLVLEVGCGLGHAALGYVAAHPDHDLIAVDVHTPGIALLLSRAEAAGVTNLRVVEGDALDVLDRLPQASLHAVHLFFPDPWPKRPHHKRRFVRQDVLDLLAAKLGVDAALRIASDDQACAAAAQAALEAHPSYRGGPAERPAWRPLGGYEAKAVAAGTGVIELCYRRC
jgi:tRNA (guanine-N7-)-methyltransferase